MFQGKTSSGFEFVVEDENIAEDAEFLEVIAEIMGGDGLKIFSALDKFIGKEQKAALYDHVRDESGHVSVTDVSNEFVEIFTQLSEGNSATKN